MVLFSALTLQQATVHPHLPWRLLDTQRQVWLSLLWGHCSFLLGPGAQAFVCTLQVSVSPVLWKFCNHIPLAFKVKFPGGFSVPLLDFQVGKSVVGHRSFATVRKLVWYNCSPVCRSSAQQIYGGANGHLLQEDLRLMPRLPSLLHPEPLSLQQATAGPMLPQTTPKHSEAGLA